jgi:hypothetical protein
MPILNGRIGKWILALSEFELKFESAKAIKGQIIADFITEQRDPSIDLLEITPWALFFYGSSCGKGLKAKDLVKGWGHLRFYLWGWQRDRGPESWCISREIWKVERLP